MKRIFIPVALGALAAAVAAHAKTETYDGAELASQAKVSVQEAEAAALQARPGVVKDKELEKEHGGLRYSFDIRQGNRIHEIGVDVATGRIVARPTELMSITMTKIR